MRILMTTDSYLPRWGGAEVHVSEIKNELEKLGHKVILYTTEIGDKEEKCGVANIWRVPWRHDYLKHLRLLWRLAGTVDVVHSHYAYRLAFLVGLVAWLRRKPFFITEHGLGILDHPGTPWLYQKVEHFYRRVSLVCATRVISTSEDLSVFLKKYITPKKIICIPNGVNVARFASPTKTSLPASVPINAKIMLTVRRLVPKCGIQYLVEAFSSVALAVPDAHWIMIGDGPLRGKITSRLKELQLLDRVTMLGALDNALIPGFYARASAVIFPSTAESTSIACLEAMAAGRPVVASAVGGLIEIVGNDNSRGYLVKIFDHENSTYNAPDVSVIKPERLQALSAAIIDVLQNPERARQISSAAQEYTARNFSWSVIVSKLLAVFTAAVSIDVTAADAVAAKNKIGYSAYHDEICLKRTQSSYPLRRYAHERQYEVAVESVRAGMRVLDAGCGEGMLSLLAARRGAVVIGCDISAPNIAAARQIAARENLSIEFLEADAEQLPFPDESFDLVLSSHVLEHLPDFDRGLRELWRVSRGQVVVALPSCMNLAALVQCGGGMFWLKGLRSFAALLIGGVRWLLNLGGEGIDEGYAGKKEFHHIWRYPWTILHHFARANFTVREVRASTLMLPFFVSFLPLVRWLDKFDRAPLLRWCGYGTTFILEKKSIKR